MNLKLITGRASTGKTTYIYNEIREKLKDSEQNIFYIVPEQMTYSSEFDFINQIDEDGLLNMQVTSFKKLEYMVFDEVGGLKLNEINDYGKIMLLKQICDNNADTLKVYRKAIYKEGFLKEFNSFIKELKTNNINATILEKIDLNKINNELLKRKLHDIINIYNKMEDLTKDNFFDNEDKTNYFIESIYKSNIIKNSYIYIDNFENFSGQRLKIIEKLIQFSKGVCLAVNIDNKCIPNLISVDDWEIFKVTYDMYFSVFNIAKELNANIENISMEKSYINNKEIKFLDDNLFKLNVSKYNNEIKNINIYNSINSYTEVVDVCSKIISLVRDEGFRYKDIAVVTAGIEFYETNIKKVFTQYDIPYFMDTKKDIMSNPFVKFIISILDMFNYNFKHNSVFEYFKSGFSDLDYNEVDKLENFSLQYGIEGNKWFRKFTYKNDNVDYYEQLRKKFASKFSKYRKSFKELKTSEDITVFLYNMFREHKIQESISKKVDEFRNCRLYELSYINTQVWNVIINVFEQIILTSNDIEINTVQYKKILESGLSEIKLGIIPPSLDKVVVGDLDRAFINKYKAIFLIGANENILLSYINNTGLLIDEEKEVLKTIGLPLLNTSTYNNFKDKHILYKVLTKATDYLYLSYAAGTVDGKALQPNIYIDKLKDIFPLLEEKSDLSYKEDINLVMNKKATLEILIEKIREYIEGKEISDLWKDVYKWYYDNSKDLIYIVNNGIDYKNVVENVKDTDIDKLYGNHLSMSVSKLENYSACPFKFFMDFGIKPVPRKELKVEYYDIGNIFHECIERFTKKIINKKIIIKEISEDNIIKEIDNSLEEVFKQNKSDNIALEYNERNKYIKYKIQRLLERTAVTMINQLKKGNFEPKETEFHIKKKIKDIEKEIYLDGRIDRIDTYVEEGKTYINIIDYKSSNKEVELSDVVNGLQLQLFVYLSSLINSDVKIDNLIPKIGGVFYFNIDDPLINADENYKNNYNEDIMKKLSLKGYVIEDMNIIKNIDEDIEDNKSSNIIPVALKKDNSFKKTSKSMDEKEYKLVLNKVDEVSKEITQKIIDGNIIINPYKKDNGSCPCDYCEYKTICQFDESIDGNNYRNIKKSNKETIISNLMIDNEK